MSYELIPFGDWVVLSLEKEDEKEKTTSSGFILVGDDPNENKLPTGKVLSVGPGVHDQNGNLVPLNIEVGTTVVYVPNQGLKQEFGDDEYYIIKAAAIMAVVKE
jgi:chaperonin GroES